MNVDEFVTVLSRELSSYSEEITEAGRYLVDGTQCLAYLRIRYTAGGDFERTHRQRI